MDFSLSDEQKALSELAEQILTDHATLDRLKALEESGECIDRDAWTKLAEAGLLGIAIPEAFGGTGAGFVELCLLLEQVGRTVAHTPVLPSLVYAALPIARFGSEEQKKKLLPAVARGEALLTAALIETGTPADQPTTRATRCEEGWRLDGVKVGVPIAEQAECILVPAQTDDGRPAVFLVAPHDAGVRLEAQETFNWETVYRMSLDGVTIKTDAVLGSPERGEEILVWLLDRATAGLCATASGVCQSAMHRTAEYVAERKQFGKPIATFQAVSQRMADCFIDNEAINLTMWQAATRLADEVPSAREVATAKFWAADGGSRIGHAALHLHGGISIDVDYPIQRYFLWIKQIEYSLGAGNEQLQRLGQLIAENRAS